MCDVDESYADLVEEIFDEWREELQNALAAAQRRGEVRADTGAEVLATQTIGTIEGAIMLARLKKQEKPFRNCIEGLETFLAAEQSANPSGQAESEEPNR